MIDVGNVRGGGAQGINQTGNVGAPPDGAGAPRGVGNEPPPVDSQDSRDSAPRIPDPQIDPKDLNARYELLKEHLAPGQVVDVSVLMQKIQELQEKLDQSQLKTAKTTIEGQKAEIKANTDKQVQKFMELKAKIDEQEKASLFKKIFGGIAIGLALVAAVATGGALAIGVAAIGAALFVAQETGGMDAMFKAMGASEDTQKWVMLGITLALMVASIGSAVHGAYTAASAASNVASTASTAASKAAMVATGAKVLGGVSTIGAGAANIGEAVLEHEATGIETDRMRLDAKQLQMKQQQDELIAELRKLLDKIESNVQITTEVVRSHSDSVQYQIRTLS